MVYAISIVTFLLLSLLSLILNYSFIKGLECELEERKSKFWIFIFKTSHLLKILLALVSIGMIKAGEWAPIAAWAFAYFIFDSECSNKIKNILKRSPINSWNGNEELELSIIIGKSICGTQFGSNYQSLRNVKPPIDHTYNNEESVVLDYGNINFSFNKDGLFLVEFIFVEKRDESEDISANSLSLTLCKDDEFIELSHQITINNLKTFLGRPSNEDTSSDTGETNLSFELYNNELIELGFSSKGNLIDIWYGKNRSKPVN